MIKQAWKKITAVTCAVAMLVTGIGVIPKVQAEEAPSNLTSLGWSDFGFTDDTVLSSKTGDAGNWGAYNRSLTASGKALKDASLRGTIKFQRESNPMYLQYGSQGSSETKGIRIQIAASGEIQVFNMWNKGTEVVKMDAQTAGLTGNTFNGVTFELGVDFWQSGETYKLNLYVNGTQYNNETYTIAGVTEVDDAICFMNQGESTCTDTIEIQMEREKAPSGLTSVTWADFGIIDDISVTASANYGIKDMALTGKTTLNSSFRGNVKFERKNSGNMWVQYGANIDSLGDCGIRFTVTTDGDLKIYDMGSNGAQLDVITPNAVNLASGTTFNNAEITLGVDVWKSGDDAKVLVYINGTQYNRVAYVITGGASKMINYVDIVGQGEGNSVTVKVDTEKAPTNLTKIGWRSYGITSETTCTSTRDMMMLSTTNVSMVDTSFRGKVKLTCTSSNNPTLAFASNGWNGLWVRLINTNKLQVLGITATGGNVSLITVTKEDHTFFEKEFELGLDVWKINDTDLKVLCYIDGVQTTKSAVVWENGVACLKQGFCGYAPDSNSFVIYPEKETSPEGLTQIGWKDFGITDDKTLTGKADDTVISSSTGHSLINTSFRGKIKFSHSGSGNLMLHFGHGSWYGLRVTVVNDGKITVGGAYPDISNSSSATITRESGGFLDKELELGLDIWKVNDNDLKINVFIDGEQVTYSAITWANAADKLNGKISGVADGQNSMEIILNQEEAPAGLPKVNWNTLGIAAGEYGYHAGGFDVLGHTNDASIKNSSFRGVLKFTDEEVALHYGDNWDGWEIGMKFALQSDGSISVVNVSGGQQTLTVLKPTSIGKDSFKGQEFELGIDSWTEGNDIKLNIYINGVQYNHAAYVWANGATSELAYDRLTVGIITKDETSPKIVVEHPAKAYVDLTTTPAGYLLSGTKIRVNDKEKTNGNTLTSAGDYHVVVVDSNGVTATDVACYKPGDAHVDGEFDIRDVVAVKKATAGQTTRSLARQKAADVKPDGNYNVDDMKAVYDLILGVATSTPNMAYSYSFRNDSDVMPIGGFVGPYDLTNTTTDYTKVNLITDDVYKKIADCGITFITGSTHGQGWNSSELILKQLKLTEKYGIDMFVKDTTWYEGTSQEISAKTLAERMAKYSNYKSFKGLFIMDEPTLVGTYGNSQVQSGSHGDLQWNRTTQLSTLLNSYSNLTAYINMLPLRHSMNRGSQTDVAAYKAYLETYCENYSPKFLSYDYYPWEWQTNVITGKGFTGDNAVNAGSYFKNLAIVRDMANQYQIPFWTHVESGDGFANNSGAGQGSNPTEGKFKWQINVELAFGAKGIQYFPLVQPNGYEVHADGTVNYRRNGLIGKDGQTNVWYNYAKEMNTQIQNMDHVLMNSVSKGLMVTGGYATSNMADAASEGMPILTQFALSGNPTITGISTNETGSSTYGAIAGCFDYCGKSAIYVVNYNVESAQNITVNWNQSHTYTKIDKNGNAPCGAATSCTLSLGAGEAALLVLE